MPTRRGGVSTCRRSRGRRDESERPGAASGSAGRSCSVRNASIGARIASGPSSHRNRRCDSSDGGRISTTGAGARRAAELADGLDERPAERLAAGEDRRPAPRRRRADRPPGRRCRRRASALRAGVVDVERRSVRSGVAAPGDRDSVVPATGEEAHPAVQRIGADAPVGRAAAGRAAGVEHRRGDRVQARDVVLAGARQTVRADPGAHFRQAPARRVRVPEARLEHALCRLRNGLRQSRCAT